MKLCIEHGRNVLCEKAFTYNAAQAEEIADLAADKNVYVAEAIWTRYMPSRQMINEILESGVIGEIKTMTCNLSYPISKIERLIRPELAGGALLDVGVYGLNFIVMHMGKEISAIESSVMMHETIYMKCKAIGIDITTDYIADRTEKESSMVRKDI